MYYKVPLRTTKYYSSITLYYDVLHSTTPYYKVLQKSTPYYKVLHSTTPHYKVWHVLHTTTMYYEIFFVLQNRTKYYSVQQSTIQYSVQQRNTLPYKILQNTTLHNTDYKVLQWTTKYYSVLRSTAQYHSVLQNQILNYKVLICLIVATYETSSSLRGATSNTQNAMELQHSCLIAATHETSCTLRGATRVTLHSHQILPLPRKKLKHHLHCAEQQYSPCNVTKNGACHQKWLASLILIAYETLCTPRGATEAPLQHHQILCPPRKMTLQNLTEIYWEKLKRHLQCAADPRPFRPWSENHPTIIREWTQPARATEVTFRAPRELSLRCSFQISPGTAPARKTGSWHSPNNAPATKSDSHDGSSSQKKCHVPCAEQQKSPSEVTKYCTCHEKLLSC